MTEFVRSVMEVYKPGATDFETIDLYPGDYVRAHFTRHRELYELKLCYVAAGNLTVAEKRLQRMLALVGDQVMSSVASQFYLSYGCSVEEFQNFRSVALAGNAQSVAYNKMGFSECFQAPSGVSITSDRVASNLYEVFVALLYFAYGPTSVRNLLVINHEMSDRTAVA